MSNPTTSGLTAETFVQQLTEQMTLLAQTASQWAQADPHPLHEVEAHVQRLLHDLGNALLSGLVQLAAPLRPAPDVPCACGQTARYQRLRPATVTTILGRMTYCRAYYQCPACGQGQTPFDTQLQVMAGGLSLGLQELSALLGATQDSFAQATSVLNKLTLVQLCPNSVRAATEDLGLLLTNHDAQRVTTAQQTHSAPPAEAHAPAHLYISMDGVLAHIHDDGWKEIKVGCLYTTRRCRTQPCQDQPHIQAEQQSYVAALTDASTFGWQLWAEAARRGVEQARDVVVIGDGAHWIWKVAADHFPDATQIVDWYHASQYVWNAATTLYGEDSGRRTAWAKQQLAVLWEGQVDVVLRALQARETAGGGVTEAMSYFTSHQNRMHYGAYRARGLQIGSGTMESGCKQVVSARLKLAGMIWNAEGADAVATVRAWLKSERWDEAMRLRPTPKRMYRRHIGAPVAA